MSLGNWRAVHEDVWINIDVNETVSPDPPILEIKPVASGTWEQLNPVIEDTDTDAIPYNEFKYFWETTGRDLGVYDVRTSDTDLAGNFGSAQDTIVLRASYGYWYGWEYSWGL